MTIGIIEDDTLLHQALKTALQNAGYQTVSAYTKQEALTEITGGESLLLIDIGLPDGNGIACYKKIRENAEIPAIFLTARDEETDMLTAFDTGADDYVVKPFSMKVLLKRIEAVLGRNNKEKQLVCGEIILLPDKKKVYKDDKEINLTAKEVPAVLEATKDGAASLFESSVSCIGVPICQHGLRNSYALLESCIQRVRKEQFADRVLPCIHISGCPSSCGSHQAGSIGLVGHSKRVDGKMEPAFKLFVNGDSEEPGAHLGIEKGVLLETVIPEFFAALGKRIAAADSTFDVWYPTHAEEFDTLAAEYAEKTQ